MLYIVQGRARTDIDHIFDYIAKDNPVYACRWLDKLYSCFDLLARFPLMGYVRLDLADASFRFWPFGRYLILYRVTAPLRIVRVLSAYRKISGVNFCFGVQ